MLELNVKNTFTTMIRGKKLEDFLKMGEFENKNSDLIPCSKESMELAQRILENTKQEREKMKFIFLKPTQRSSISQQKAFESILKTEGYSMMIEENTEKSMKLSKGSGQGVLIMIQGDDETVIGTHYRHLVEYFESNGLMQC